MNEIPPRRQLSRLCDPLGAEFLEDWMLPKSLTSCKIAQSWSVSTTRVWMCGGVIDQCLGSWHAGCPATVSGCRRVRAVSTRAALGPGSSSSTLYDMSAQDIITLRFQSRRPPFLSARDGVQKQQHLGQSSMDREMGINPSAGNRHREKGPQAKRSRLLESLLFRVFFCRVPAFTSGVRVCLWLCLVCCLATCYQLAVILLSTKPTCGLIWSYQINLQVFCASFCHSGAPALRVSDGASGSGCSRQRGRHGDHPSGSVLGSVEAVSVPTETTGFPPPLGLAVVLCFGF